MDKVTEITQGFFCNFDRYPSEVRLVEKWTPLRSCPLYHKHYDGDDEVRLRSYEPSKDKYMRPISQASLFSIKTALVKRKQACSLGKIPTTRVRRLTS
jgi:hypothetical protein